METKIFDKALLKIFIIPYQDLTNIPAVPTLSILMKDLPERIIVSRVIIKG